MQKLHQVLVHFFVGGGGGRFDYKLGFFFAKMLAADQSNADFSGP